MTKTFIFLLIFLFSISLKAQDSRDSIISQKTFFGHRYFINDIKVSSNKVSDILRANESTDEILTSSRNKKTIGYILLVGGSLSALNVIMESWTIHNNYGVLPNSSGFYISSVATAVCLIASEMFISDGNRKYQRAIKIYNKDVVSPKQTTELNFNVGLNYLSLSYRF